MASSFDVLGDTLSGLSVVGQAFSACVRGFEVWQKGKAIVQEVTFFQVKLEIQAARFKAWGCGWGIEKSRAYMQHPKFKQNGDLAIDCMNLIVYQTNSLKNLDAEFPVLKVAARPPGIGKSFELLSELADPKLRQEVQRLRLHEKVGSVENNVTLQEKLKWGWQDGEALKKLTILESLIDGLYQLLPPPDDDPLAAMVLNSSLASNDIETLDAIGEQGKDNPLQSAVAWLKSAILKFETRSTILQDREVQKIWLRLSKIRHRDPRNSRAVGTYDDSDVLIEWKTIRSGLSQTDATVLDRRIKDVARVLRSDLKPEEMRTLSCIGVIEKYDEDQTQYGLLYSLPSPSTSHSLRDLISLRKNLLLGDYFTIAQVLSKALLYLHLAGWLHKGIRSDNVLFFANDIAEVLPAYPYLVGFEYSRAHKENALTEDLIDDKEFNLYRHPDSQGVPINPVEDGSVSGSELSRAKQPYRPEYDIYSLGVILVELGVRKTAQTIYEQACATQVYGRHSAERFRSWLIDGIAPQLGTKMGKLYRDSTLFCLRGNFDRTGRTLEAAFYMDVVKNLEKCHA
jgi:Prion-inhibition and propagation